MYFMIEYDEINVFLYIHFVYIKAHLKKIKNTY